MSKKQNGRNKIPVPIIILGFFLSPPVGVVLLLLSVLSGNKDKKPSANQNPAGQQNGTPYFTENGQVGSASPSKSKKGRKSGFSKAALVLGILSGVFLVSAGINAIDGLTSGFFFTADYLGSTLTMLCLGIAAAVASVCCRQKNECRNVIRSIIGKRDTISLSKLASAADLSMRKLRHELQTMISDGEFGEEAYLDLASGMFLRYPIENTAEAEAEQETRYETAEGETPDRFRAIILQIRKLNDEIKDYAVSERIYRIEEHTQNIFDYVTENPEAMNQIKTFMNYYLPTTLKLLESYSRIEQVGVAGENMKKSKENIERILDLLVVGYEQQVDQLFRHESMDISSEIKVLEAMMKQDGLDGKNDFAIPQEPERYSGSVSDPAYGGFEGGAAAQQRPAD